MSDQLSGETFSSLNSVSSPTVFVVFGSQGSGKSTQVNRLADRLKLTVFEAGQVLRERAKLDGKLDRQINQGVLVANVTMEGIVDNFVDEHRNINGYILDGYPRNISQFNDLITLSGKHNWRVAGIFVNISDMAAKLRLSTRFQLVNGQRLARKDDKPEIVQRRLNTFRKETLPLKDKFKQRFELMEIDGEPSVDDVTAQIDLAVNRFLNVRNKN